MKLVTGLSGSGKSTYVYENIRQDLLNGRSVLVIVPDREAVEAETALVEYLNGTPSQRLDVYSFSRMCNDFFRKFGELCYNYLDKTSSNLLTFLALCNVAEALTEYKNVKITDKDVISSLNASVKQLKTSGVAPSMLEKTIAEMKEDGDVSEKILNRLEDILTVYSAKEALIKDGYGDPDDDITHMLAMLPNAPYFKDKCVYLDSFVGFTGPQYNVLKFILRQAREVTLTLLLPQVLTEECESTVFAPTYATYKKLCKTVSDEKKDIDRIVLDLKNGSDELYCLKRTFTENTVFDGIENEKIRMYAFSGIYDEVDAVCADIAEKVRNGARFNDFSIVLSDMKTYAGILDEALEHCGIKAYVSDKGMLAEKTFIKFVFSALDVCSSGFAASDVVSYLKTGLHELSDETVFKLENYIKTWKISGKYFYSEPWTMNPAGYSYEADDTEQTLDELNRARDYIITPLYDLSNKINGDGVKVSDFIDALHSFFVRTNVSHTLAEMNKKAVMYMGEKEGKEQEQVWNLFFSALETLQRFCGDIPLTCKMFSSLLSLVIGCVDIGTIPTYADAVSVDGIDNLYCTGRKYVYVLGAIEGKLPPTAPQSAFTQPDISALDMYGLQVGVLDEIFAENSYFSFYKACTGARKELWISYYTSDVKGETCLPSSYLDSLFTAFPMLKDKMYSTPSGTDLIYSPQKGFQYYSENRDTSEGQAVKNVISDVYGDNMKLFFDDISLLNTSDFLSDNTLKEFYRGDLKLSQSKIKSFTDCKFAYYCKYGLGLKEPAESQLGASELGTFIHYVLQKLLEDCIFRREEMIKPFTPSELCDRYMSCYIENVLHIGEKTRGLPRLKALFKRMKRNLVPIVEYVLSELDSSDFKPVKVEMKIDNGCEVSPVKIKLSDGTNAYLTGIADRMDLFEKDGVQYVKLTDYKTGDNSFNFDKLEEYEGIQLFMYMISVCESSGEKYKPAAVFYMSGVVSEREVSASEDSDFGAEYTVEKRGAFLDDEEIKFALAHGDTKYLKIPARSNTKSIAVVTDKEFEETFDRLKSLFAELAETMKSGAAHAVPKTSGQNGTCVYCPYKFICRRTERR